MAGRPIAHHQRPPMDVAEPKHAAVRCKPNQNQIEIQRPPPPHPAADRSRFQAELAAFRTAHPEARLGGRGKKGGQKKAGGEDEKRVRASEAQG